MMRKWLWVLALVLGAAVVNAGGESIVTARPVHDSASALRLEQVLSPLDTLSADFEQRVTDADGYEIQAMEGTMTVARPGKIYWRTHPPFEQLLISDSETLWLYDQDLEQVTVRPFDDDIARTPAVLLIGKVENLDEKYAVSSSADGEATEYTLVPMEAEALYRKVTLRFLDKTPVAMGLWDSLGQLTTISFSNVKLNTAIEQGLFHFEIPEGVDVLYE